MSTNNIDIHDLYKSIDTKNQNKKKTFEQVLDRVHSKIKLAAKNDHYACFYPVPEFIIGIPLYNITECIEYLISALKDNGFFIRFIYPNNIYISWDPKDINRSDFTSHRIEHKTEEQIDQFLLQHKPQRPQRPWQQKNGKFSLNLDEL